MKPHCNFILIPALCASMAGCSNDAEDVNSYFNGQNFRAAMNGYGYDFDEIKITDQTPEGGDKNIYTLRTSNIRITEEVRSSARKDNISDAVIKGYLDDKLKNSFITMLCEEYRNNSDLNKEASRDIIVDSEFSKTCMIMDKGMPIDIKISMMSEKRTPHNWDMVGTWECRHNQGPGETYIQITYMPNKKIIEFTLIDAEKTMIFGDLTITKDTAKMKITGYWTKHGLVPANSTMNWTDLELDGTRDHYFSYNTKFSEEQTNSYKCNYINDNKFSNARTQATTVALKQ